MKIDRQIVTIVEHLLIRDIDDGTVYVNQRMTNNKPKPDTNPEVRNRPDENK